MSLYNLIQLVTTIFAYSVIGFYLYLLALGVFRFVLRDYLGLFQGRGHSLHCPTRFSLSRLKAMFGRLGAGSCNSMPKVKAKATKNLAGKAPLVVASKKAQVQTRFVRDLSGAPLVGSKVDRYPQQRSNVGICPKQHGFRIHTQHALSLRRC